MATSQSAGAEGLKAAVVIANELRRKIIEGEIPVQGSLPAESLLIEEYGVSRPTLRAALRILESEELITVRRGSRGGAWVNAPQPAALTHRAGVYMQYHQVALDEVQRARLFIEPPAVRLLAQRADPEQSDRLSAMAELERSLFEDPRALSLQALEFHRALLAMCGNKTLDVFGYMIFGTIEKHLPDRQRPLPDRAHRAVDRNKEHLRVVELIRSGDEDGASRLWTEHLGQVRDAMLSDHDAGQPVLFL